jgi:heme/copper-type cytochrome/quinol oxidase subunit 4
MNGPIKLLAGENTVHMHAHEVHEKAAHAHSTGNKAIGLTIAVLAVLSAFVTTLSSHTSTEKVIVETKIADWWAYSHSSDSNSRLYDVNAKVAELSMANGAAVSRELRAERDKQSREASEARATAQKLEHESAGLGRKINYYSGAELFLQLSVVLCSVSLLTEVSRFWKASFASTAVGCVLAVVGIVLH